MVLIPNDAGVRLRMQTETAMRPILPVAEIPADLLELRPGQTFSARIQEVLPENTYKALVAGRSLTLALPEGAKTGDTLELVVLDRTPRLIVAQLANRTGDVGSAAAADNAFTRLSPTAQLIGSLLARDGSPSTPAALTRGEPLLPQPPADSGKMATQLAPLLAKAVTQSGLFYEAHQVQWVMGQRPVSDLLAEPQARHSTAPAPAPAATGREAENQTGGSTSAGSPSPAPGGAMVLLQNLFGSDETRQQSGTTSNPQATPSPAQAMPEELRPLVQQQLDAAATQRMVWHGEVWPGQALNWQIEPDQQRSKDAQSDADRGWVTSLRLITPRLGEIDAKLNLTAQGARITVTTPIGASAADLLDAAPVLEQSMTAAGVPLLGLQIKHDKQD